MHIQEYSTVGYVARSIPKINATLDDHKVEYQLAKEEFEGNIVDHKIVDHSIYVLIDSRASLGYISPKIVELSDLQAIKFGSPWFYCVHRCMQRRS